MSAGALSIRQGQIRWIERLHEKRRPGLIVSRDETINVLSDVLVIPLTTNIRGLPTEIRLGSGDGVRRASVANAQRIDSVRKSCVGELLGNLAPGRWFEVCDAVAIAISC